MGVSGVRLGVLGGCRVAELDFDELRARLSPSYVTALLFVVGADHCVRCFVVARALCLLQQPPPTRTQLKGHSQSNYVKFGEKPASGAKVKGTKRRARESSSSEEEEEEDEDEEEEEEEEEEEDEDEDDDCSAPGVAAPGSPQRRRR